MTTYEITLSQDHVPTWGLKEAIREFLQNAIDADKAGFPMEVYHSGKSLFIINKEGAYLTPNTMVIGKTTKLGQNSQIGENGEGYKLGSMSLLRIGKKVKVFNYAAPIPEKWDIIIGYSKKFQEDILMIKSSKIALSTNKLIFKINDISKNEWEECKGLLLSNYNNYKSFDTSYGTILDGESVKGKIFVGGLFIVEKSELNYGYSFEPKILALNRDRSIIDMWNFYIQTAKIWNETINDKKWFNKFTDLLNENASEVEKISYYGSQEIAQKVYSNFINKYGENSYPVYNESRENALHFMGINAVSVSRSVSLLLKPIIGSIEDKIKEYNNNPITIISEDELTFNEKKYIQTSFKLIRAVDPQRDYPYKVVKFAGEFLGRWEMEEKIVLLDRNSLVDLRTCLMTVVHEVCHDIAGDGEAIFHAEVQELWSKIALYLLRLEMAVF